MMLQMKLISNSCQSPINRSASEIKDVIIPIVWKACTTVLYLKASV